MLIYYLHYRAMRDSKRNEEELKSEKSDLKADNERLKKNIEELARLHQKKKNSYISQISEIKAKCNDYKNKVRVANEKINSLGTKIAHIELEYRNS